MIISKQVFTDFQAGRIQGFYHEVYPSLLTYAVRCLGETYGYLAEDCVQESIFKAYNHSSEFLTANQLKNYLYICIHNDAVSVLRKHYSRQNYLREQVDMEEDVNRAIIEQETIDLLYDAISRLPDDLHTVFTLSFEQGLKNAEVGQRMGISESAVKKKKAKMIQLLRDYFAGNEKVLVLLAIITSSAFV